MKGVFQPPGTTILGLRIGGGVNNMQPATPPMPLQAQALFIDEINIATGAIVKTIAIPSTGNILGQNLAATLSTGQFASASWNFRVFTGRPHLRRDRASSARRSRSFHALTAAPCDPNPITLQPTTTRPTPSGARLFSAWRPAR